MDSPATVESIMTLIRQLPPEERLKIIAQTAAETASEVTPSKRRPKKSMEGLLADLGPAPTAEEIDEARREMWGNFPREDI